MSNFIPGKLGYDPSTHKLGHYEVKELEWEKEMGSEVDRMQELGRRNREINKRIGLPLVTSKDPAWKAVKKLGKGALRLHEAHERPYTKAELEDISRILRESEEIEEEMKMDKSGRYIN